jgi:toxin ParE1/3/4
MHTLPVVFRERAYEDLFHIQVFLCANGAPFHVAEAYTDRIVSRCLKIGDAPNGYPLREELGEGIRVVPFEASATIAYRCTEKTAEVMRIFYGGQDL